MSSEDKKNPLWVEIERFELISSLLKTRDKTRIKLNRVYNEIKDSPLFIHRFQRLLIASGVKNDGWLRGELIHLLNYDYEQIIFEMPFNSHRYLKEKFRTLILNGLKKLSQSDSLLLKMFIYHYSFLEEDSDDMKALRSKLNLNWSLNQIRSLQGSMSLGEPFRGFWYRVLIRRSSDLEVDYFLSSLLNKKSIKGLKDQDLWILKKKFPYQEPAFSQVIKRFDKLWSSSNPYYKFMVLNFALDKTIKKKLSALRPEFRKAHYKIKRKLFRSFLTQKVSLSFTIYQLLSIGDYRKEILEEL